MGEEASFPFKLGHIVESKYNTDGYRGAWFKSEIVKISARNGGELWCALKYPDYPDEKVTWTKAYQFSPSVNKDSRQKNKELMLRPAFPPVMRRNNYDQKLYVGLTVAVVDDEWKVGDLVDWWADDCFWECQITEMLDQGNVKVELPKRPFGEGKGCPYIVASELLRPSLTWCSQYGWTVPSKVKPHERSCVSLVTVQAEASSVAEISQDLSIEPCIADRKPFEGDELAESSQLEESSDSGDDVLNRGKTRCQKMERVSKILASDFGSSRNVELEQIESNDKQPDIKVGPNDSDSRGFKKEIVKPTELNIHLKTKLSLSKKILQKAKHRVFAQRYAPSILRPTVQQKLGDVQGGSKHHLESADSILEDHVVNIVPFRVATPPLFSECRERSGEASPCNRTAQSSGSSDPDTDENNGKTSLSRTDGKGVLRETCEEKQIGSKLSADAEESYFQGAALCPSEHGMFENLLIPHSSPDEALPFTTIVWEDPCDSQKEYQNSLQQANFQPQPCILALPAFNGMKEHERAQWCKNKVRPLQRLWDVSESHAQRRKILPLHWQHSRINTNCSRQYCNKSVYASRSKGESLPSNYSLEARNLQPLNRKSAARHEESGQKKHYKASSYGETNCEVAQDEEMIRTVLALEEISEKVVFMRDCLQLGMSRLFQKREKAAVWSVTTNIEGMNPNNKK